MGCFFGGLLAENGLNVVLVDVWKEHVDNINKHGLKISGVGGERYKVFFKRSFCISCKPVPRFVKVRATSDPSGETCADVVFVQCKAAHTRAAISGASSLYNEVTNVNN